MSNFFLQSKTNFRGRVMPEEGYLVGYSLLASVIESKTQKAVPLPPQLAIVTDKFQRYNTRDWQVFTKRHQPPQDILSHVVFALKYEGIDLYVLKEVFELLGKDAIVNRVKEEPTGQYSRKIWFLYEWLFHYKLPIPDLKKGTYVDVVDPLIQYPGPSRNSTRHRLRNNLPGTPAFCPMIRKTEKLEAYIGKDLSQRVESGLEKKDRDLIRRTAAFLLLKDSKASFAIEGEHPPDQRARNWGKAIGEAGKSRLTFDEITRLQDIVIGSKKLKNMGLRSEEGFIGEHDRETFSPIPDHISARSEDLPELMKGLLGAHELLQQSDYDAVLTAATVAFGFVFIHPLADGNGRIHRYLIHHILAERGFAKRDMIFPVSSAILDNLATYQDVLESYSHPRLDLIAWKETATHNVQILNDTADLYRYFDLTLQAEFLYSCVEDTIERIIPAEIEYLEKYDRLNQFINSRVTLPNQKVDLLVKLLIQNRGTLSKNKRERSFEELTDTELQQIEDHYREIYLNN